MHAWTRHFALVNKPILFIINYIYSFWRRHTMIVSTQPTYHCTLNSNLASNATKLKDTICMSAFRDAILLNRHLFRDKVYNARLPPFIPYFIFQNYISTYIDCAGHWLRLWHPVIDGCKSWRPPSVRHRQSGCRRLSAVNTWSGPKQSVRRPNCHHRWSHRSHPVTRRQGRRYHFELDGWLFVASLPVAGHHCCPGPVAARWRHNIARPCNTLHCWQQPSIDPWHGSTLLAASVRLRYVVGDSVCHVRCPTIVN